MKGYIKKLLRESLLSEGKIKKGSPEELLELLKYLPDDETAKYISSEIITDLNKFYQEDVVPEDKTYTYYPKDKCLKPYELEVDFAPSNSSTSLGYASQNYIRIKYLSKDSREFGYTRGSGNVHGLIKRLYNIIKHECGHYYLGLRGVEECIYNTHVDGMKKYYHDRQEIVLHTREIWDDFIDDYPNWQRRSLEWIRDRIRSRVKGLRSHTNIHAPFGGGLQNKYVAFIMNNYIKPNYDNPEFAPKLKPKKEINVLLDKGQREAINNALMVINNINNSGKDFKKEIEVGYGPNGSNRVKFKIKNKEQADFDVKLEVRPDSPKPYYLMVSRGYKGEPHHFKNFDELINFIKTIKLTDYVRGDDVNSPSSTDSGYEKITKLLKSGDKDNIDLAFAIAKNQGINPNSLNKLLKLYQN